MSSVAPALTDGGWSVSPNKFRQAWRSINSWLTPINAAMGVVKAKL